MSGPQLLISKNHRTNGKSLATSVVQQVLGKLLGRGFVLLPSDTCYSLGALAIDESVRKNVNTVLNRKDEPISIAFSSYLQVRRLIKMNNTVALLLERFTPGPITIVCKAKDDLSREFLSHTIGSGDGTVGVRIPDSSIERDIAASTQYQLMTIAVRDPETGEAIQNFGRAQEIVSLGIEKVEGAKWAAIESHTIFHALHSTVVRVDGVGKVKLLREGDISFEEILDAVHNISGWAVEDWT